MGEKGQVRETEQVLGLLSTCQAWGESEVSWTAWSENARLRLNDEKEESQIDWLQKDQFCMLFHIFMEYIYNSSKIIVFTLDYTPLKAVGEDLFWASLLASGSFIL